MNGKEIGNIEHDIVKGGLFNLQNVFTETYKNILIKQAEKVDGKFPYLSMLKHNVSNSLKMNNMTISLKPDPKLISKLMRINDRLHEIIDIIDEE